MSDNSQQIAIDVENQKWIFVGGKGGVGKTSISSSLALRLCKKYPDEKVLLISTDPAHNLSDVFDQNFSGKPLLVKGLQNLFVMEVDPSREDEISSQIDPANSGSFESLSKFLNSVLGVKNAISLIPGCDEAFAIVQTLNFADQAGEYRYLIFDTAPTGHTLRLLHLPIMLSKLVNKAVKWIDEGGMGWMNQIGQMVSPDIGEKIDEMTKEAKNMKTRLDKLVSILKDPNQSQFICVCIAEKLSIYENERLILSLDEDEITKVRNIVVNRVDISDQNSNCPTCNEKRAKQCENIKIINEIYIDPMGDVNPMDNENPMDDFGAASEKINVHFIPVVPNEIKGVQNLENFSKFLMDKKTSDSILDYACNFKN